RGEVPCNRSYVVAVTDRCGHDRACSSERTDDGEAIEHGQHTSFQVVDGQAGFCRRRTRSYVAIRREIMRDFSEEDGRTPHKRLGHITGADWLNCDPRVGVVDVWWTEARKSLVAHFFAGTGF